MTCTTHHHACECREAEFELLKSENARLRETVAQWEEIYSLICERAKVVKRCKDL